MKRPILIMLFVLACILVVTKVIKAFNEEVFYKWKGEDGTWNYADEAGSEGHDAEVIKVRTDTNLIQGPKPEEEIRGGADKESNDTSNQNANSEKSSSIPAPITVPLERVHQMIKDAKDVQGLINSREEEIKRATGS
jgi:hypothetical protein